MFIIIKKQHERDLPISALEGLVVLSDDGNVAVFLEEEAALSFIYENDIDGQIVELPVY